MAFQSAPNYGNLPNGVWSPTIFSRKVQKAFRKTAVVQDITNSDYFGEIKNYGDSVKIIKEPEVNVVSYARGQKLTSQDLEDSDFTLVIDKANAFQFRVDDIEVAQSHVNWMDLASDRAAYQIAQEFDKEVLAYMSGYVWHTATPSNPTGGWTVNTSPTGTKADPKADGDELLARHKLERKTFVPAAADGTSISIGVAGTFDLTPLQLINRFNTLFDLMSVPKDNRWIILDPVFIEKLMDEDSKFINSLYNPGVDQLNNGRLAENMIRGFRVYESNNLPRFGDGPAIPSETGSTTDYGVIIAGVDSAVATAEQISKTESFRDPDSFGDITRGMHLYGRKILRPEGLLRAIYNVNQ